MFNVKLVPVKPERTTFSPRVNSISSETKSTNGKIFRITTHRDAKDFKRFRIGITKEEHYKVNASLSYEIIPPEYSDMANKYTVLAQEAQIEINKIKSKFVDVTTSLEIKPNTDPVKLTDAEKEQIGRTYFVSKKENPSGTMLNSIISQSENNYLEAVDTKTKRKLTAEASDKVKYLTDIKEKHEATANSWREIGEDSREKFGYSVLFTIKVGELGCDVRSLRLNSSKGPVIEIKAKPLLVPNKTPVYQYRSMTLSASNFSDLEDDFSTSSLNKHYMSGQTYYAIETVTEPTTFYWLEVSNKAGKWLKGSGTTLSFNGLTLVTVTEIDEDAGTITAEDAAGNFYSAKLSDFSKISVGDKIHLAKKFNNLTKTSDDKKVKIDNGEGTKGEDFTTVVFEVYQ